MFKTTNQHFIVPPESLARHHPVGASLNAAETLLKQLHMPDNCKWLADKWYNYSNSVGFPTLTLKNVVQLFHPNLKPMWLNRPCLCFRTKSRSFQFWGCVLIILFENTQLLTCIHLPMTIRYCNTSSQETFPANEKTQASFSSCSVLRWYKWEMKRRWCPSRSWCDITPFCKHQSSPLPLWTCFQGIQLTVIGAPANIQLKKHAQVRSTQ